MSEAASADNVTHEEATQTAPLFNQADLDQFDADDTTAGRAIGKMLSWFFLYTILAMSIAAWWTYKSIN